MLDYCLKHCDSLFFKLFHHSLANHSNDVRWSIDLRWQSPHENWGFYDIAEGIVFRTASDGDVKPDWDKFLSVDRKEVWQKKYFKQVREPLSLSHTEHGSNTVYSVIHGLTGTSIELQPCLGMCWYI